MPNPGLNPGGEVTRLTVTVHADTASQLTEAARHRGVPCAAVAREAIEEQYPPRRVGRDDRDAPQDLATRQPMIIFSDRE